MPMDDYLLRVIGNGTGATLEWFAVFCFVAFGVVYFLAPVLGYQRAGRTMLLAALCGLVGYGLLVLLQLLIQYIIFLDGSSGSGKAVIHLTYIFGILKLVVFLASQGAFVVGLQGLRREGGAR
jgi:hypothetical protein